VEKKWPSYHNCWEMTKEKPATLNYNEKKIDMEKSDQTLDYFSFQNKRE
jgi:hypothetical protein